MNLFILNKETYEVEVSPEAMLIGVFKKVVSKDRSINKVTAKLEIAYIYFFADIKSNYQYIEDKSERSIEIAKDIKLPKGWKPDKRINDAIDYYNSFPTINETIYSAAIQSAQDVSSYLRNTKKHLADGLDITKITNAIKAMPQIMKDLKAAEKEIILEQKESSGRSKGAKTFNILEDGNY